jgi:hypothetical protein
VARSAAKKEASGIRPTYSPDVDEQEALAAAAATLSGFTSVANPEAVTAAVISRWIIERMKRTTRGRLADNVVFDLQEAKLRGMLEAALPQIAAGMDGVIPFDVAFGDLSKEQAIDLFLIGCIAHREAAVAAGESGDFPFSDPIPFGEAANG